MIINEEKLTVIGFLSISGKDCYFEYCSVVVCETENGQTLPFGRSKFGDWKLKIGDTFSYRESIEVISNKT